VLGEWRGRVLGLMRVEKEEVRVGGGSSTNEIGENGSGIGICASSWVWFFGM